MENVADDSPVAYALAEARDLAGRPSFWLSLLGAAFVIGLIGPFGTFQDMPLVVRLAYWAAVCATTFWIGFLPSATAAAILERRGASTPVLVACGGLAGSVPVTIWLAGLHWVVFGASFVEGAIVLYAYVAVICVAVSALFQALTAHETAHETAREVVAAHQRPPPDTPAWLDRLPDALGKDLMLLQSQDHYLRAVTPKGETLVRAALREAVKELGRYGVRVHRSWWVARDWIGAYEYRGGAPVVVLKNGQAVPVGRAYRSRVRDALGPR